MKMYTRKYMSQRLSKKQHVQFYIDQTEPTKLILENKDGYIFIEMDNEQEVKQLMSIAHKIWLYREEQYIHTSIH